MYSQSKVKLICVKHRSEKYVASTIGLVDDHYKHRETTTSISFSFVDFSHTFLNTPPSPPFSSLAYIYYSERERKPPAWLVIPVLRPFSQRANRRERESVERAVLQRQPPSPISRQAVNSLRSRASFASSAASSCYTCRYMTKQVMACV